MMSMGRRIQPRAESGICNPILVHRQYPSDNIRRVNSRTDLEEITGTNNDRERNASTAESNSDDRQSDATSR